MKVVGRRGPCPLPGAERLFRLAARPAVGTLGPVHLASGLSRARSAYMFPLPRHPLEPLPADTPTPSGSSCCGASSSGCLSADALACRASYQGVPQPPSPNLTSGIAAGAGSRSRSPTAAASTNHLIPLVVFVVLHWVVLCLLIVAPVAVVRLQSWWRDDECVPDGHPDVRPATASQSLRPRPPRHVGGTGRGACCATRRGQCCGSCSSDACVDVLSVGDGSFGLNVTDGGSRSVFVMHGEGAGVAISGTVPREARAHGHRLVCGRAHGDLARSRLAGGPGAGRRPRPHIVAGPTAHRRPTVFFDCSLLSRWRTSRSFTRHHPAPAVSRSRSVHACATRGAPRRARARARACARARARARLASGATAILGPTAARALFLRGAAAASCRCWLDDPGIDDDGSRTSADARLTTAAFVPQLPLLRYF